VGWQIQCQYTRGVRKTNVDADYQIILSGNPGLAVENMPAGVKYAIKKNDSKTTN
jgi:hypothetical protein